MITLGRRTIQPHIDAAEQAVEMLSILKQTARILDGPIADLLTGDQMADSGAYDLLTTIRAAIAKSMFS